MNVRCAGSMTFPTNYDGEYTRCGKCSRKLKLHLNGKVPNHNPVAPSVPKINPSCR